ncbi:molybdopterin converting factor subunit 1 [Hahella ganghwensis]|uniref:molybdopterin converting factor subunit 1 n=1 Tax=Hahella ganghwensis TaxID=286420 RepID=UPI000369CD9F|nr:molybdopterin converting factor subunit 1 [Hahella ganghwensis]
MIKVLFFARLREAMGCSEVEVDWDDHDGDLHELKQRIIQQLPQAESVFAQGKVLCAVNQEMVKADHRLKDGDEVAFFPPVTGG